MALGALTDAIAYEESGGNYGALGKTTSSGDRAYGKYQVMGSNIPQWTREALGFSLTPQQFLNSPQAQEAVAKVKLGQYLSSTGSPADAASMWFTGKPAAEGASLRDANGVTGAQYVENVTRNMRDGASSLSAVPDQDILGDALNPIAAGAAAQAASGIAPKAPVPLSAPVLNAVPETDILGGVLGTVPAAAPAHSAQVTAPLPNAQPGPNGLLWDANGGHDPKTGQLVIAGKPFESSVAHPQLLSGAMGVLGSVPIAGPYLQSGVEKAAAGYNALRTGTPYPDNLNQIQGNVAAAQQGYPTTAKVGSVLGSVAGTLPAIAAAPEVFGADATAPWWSNAISGGASGAVLSGADTAVRGGTPEQVGRNALIGGALGGGSAIAGSALGALGHGMTGGMMPTEDAALAQAARDKYGIPLNLGDLAAPNSLGKFAASASNRLPFSGAEGFETAQQNAFNRSVAQTIGEDAERLTPGVMNSARTRIGSVFDGVAAHTQIQADVPFDNAMLQTMTDAGKELSTDELKPLNNIFENIIDKIDPSTRAIDGSTYQAITRANTPLGRALSSPNPNVSYYAGQIKDALDDALTRSAAPEDVAALEQAKDQWRNLKTIEPLVARGGGNISPGALAQTINSSRFSKNAMAYGGGGNLGELAQIGTRFLREPQSSGTAERGAAYAAMAEVPAAVGSILAGHPFGAAALPAFLGGNRVANALMRSSWLTNPLINRSLSGNEPGIFRPLAQGASLGAGNALAAGQ